jgi:hypothetical protein
MDFSSMMKDKRVQIALVVILVAILAFGSFMLYNRMKKNRDAQKGSEKPEDIEGPGGIPPPRGAAGAPAGDAQTGDDPVVVVEEEEA